MPPGCVPPVSSSGARPLVAVWVPMANGRHLQNSCACPPTCWNRAKERAFPRGDRAAHDRVGLGAAPDRGISAGLDRAGAVVVDIVDCGYDAATQVAAIERLVRLKPDAVISIPVGSTAVAGAFRKLTIAGIKLVLLDNAPSGLLQETDYVSVVSSDNFGLGQIAASLLSPHIRRNGTVCIVAYNVDFFATAQREIAFGKWMRRERPDITLTHLKFEVPAQAGSAVGLSGRQSRSGRIVCRLGRACGCIPTGFCRPFPASGHDNCGSRERNRGGPCGWTDRQGGCRATAFRTRRDCRDSRDRRADRQYRAAWIVLPGVAVTADNVAEVYEHVGGGARLTLNWQHLNSYLSVMRLAHVEVATGARSRWRPFNVRTIMIEMDNIPFRTMPAEGRLYVAVC